MADNPEKQPAGASGSEIPNETVRGWISILLVAHLFCLFVAMSANLSPSLLQERLLSVLGPYTQLLNFDLNFTPYYLTHANVNDTDHRIEVLPRGLDEANEENWLTLPDTGSPASDRYQRYQRLGSVMAFQAEREEGSLAGVIAKDVATNFYHQRDVQPSRVRCRRRLLQGMEVVGTGNPAERDPFNAMYIREPYAANTLISNGVVSIVKIDPASRVARPDSDDK